MDRDLERLITDGHDDIAETISLQYFTHPHMDHIGDALTITKVPYAVERILASTATKIATKIALTDAVKIAQTDYERAEHDFEVLFKKLKSAKKTIREFTKKPGVKRNKKGERVENSDAEMQKEERYEEAKNVFKSKNMNVNEDIYNQLTPPKKPEYNDHDVARLYEKTETIDFENKWVEVVP